MITVTLTDGTDLEFEADKWELANDLITLKKGETVVVQISSEHVKSIDQKGVKFPPGP